MRQTLLFLFLILNPISSPAQLQGANWVFGDSVGLNFSTGNPLFYQSSINTVECSASISDNNGNLLLYVGAHNDAFNGYFMYCCWNRFHQKIIGGDSLFGNASVTQGVLILQDYSDTNKYYILHIDNYPSNNGGRFYFSSVDLSGNNGNGLMLGKNIFIDDSLSEKMIAVKHANGRDWWVILHKLGTNDFVNYLLNPSGISLVNAQPVGPSIGTTISDYGQMVSNKEGNKILMANYEGQLELFDFDRCSGVLSLVTTLGDLPYNRVDGYYGCSFSENNNYIYASTMDSLFQFDLNATNIKASKKLIFVSSNVFIGQHLFSYDEGKIYIALYNTLYDSLNKYLSIINLPEQPDTLCGFQPYSFSLNGRRHGGGLPNMPNYNLGRLIGSPCDTLTSITNVTEEELINISPNPTNQKLTIDSKQKINSYKLTDVKGVTFKEEKLSTSKHFEIDLSNIKQGIYFLHIETDKGVFVKKVIRQAS
jgi:Secretion system C-terminal sorting domain